jgi:hypothetical protein
MDDIDSSHFQPRIFIYMLKPVWDVMTTVNGTVEEL